MADDLLGTGGFGQLHSQHGAALLSLAGIAAGRLAVQRDVDVLPVGSHGAEAAPPFLCLGGIQRRAQTLQSEAGFIFQRKALGAPADGLVVGRRQRRQRFEIGLPPCCDRLACLGQLVVVDVQHLGGAGGAGIVLEQGVFLLHHPQIPAVFGQIAGVQLAQRRVDELAPSLRAAFDKA